MEFDVILFWALAVVTLVPALMVMVARDIVRVAFWLLASLGGVAGLYIMLDADFLGFTQVLVYIGGILVLILFGIMMTNRDAHLVRVEEGRRRSAITGLVVAVLTFAALASAILGTGFEEGAGRAGTTPTAPDIGRALLSDYVLPFEIISVLLLVVLCGSAYIARRAAPGTEEADHA